MALLLVGAGVHAVVTRVCFRPFLHHHPRQPSFASPHSFPNLSSAYVRLCSVGSSLSKRHRGFSDVALHAMKLDKAFVEKVRSHMGACRALRWTVVPALPPPDVVGLFVPGKARGR